MLRSRPCGITNAEAEALACNRTLFKGEHVTRSESPNRLSPDAMRTTIAGALALLAFGGWSYSMARSELRAVVATQSAIWWIEQLLILAQAAVCFGIVLKCPALVRPALWLTVLALAFGALHWLVALTQLRISLPVTSLLNALFLWRLVEADTPAVVAPAG